MCIFLEEKTQQKYTPNHLLSTLYIFRKKGKGVFFQWLFNREGKAILIPKRWGKNLGPMRSFPGIFRNISSRGIYLLVEIVVLGRKFLIKIGIHITY